MKEIITKVTNFVNENTMLLIGICAFLILVLIIYLIDNSIKTKKMQKAIKEMDATEDKVIESDLDEDSSKEEDTKLEETKYDSISLVDEEPTPEVKEDVPTPEFDEEVNIEIEPAKEEVSESTPVEEKEEPVVEQVATPVKTEESKFTNKKSLSEILSKKKESINKNDIDKTLDETTEFNNTF